MQKMYSIGDILDELQERVESSSQAQVAEEVGFSRAFLNDVLHGRRNITEGLASAMGFEKQPDRYSRKES